MEVSQFFFTQISPFQPLQYMEAKPAAAADEGCKNECRQIHAGAARDQPIHLGSLLARRTLVERRQIRETYRTMFGEDLIEHLQRIQLSSPKNEMWDVVCLWMLETHERDVIVAREAAGCDAGGEGDYNALVEIYARRKSSQLFLTKQAYLARFKRHLEQDIISETPHPTQRILEALASSHRSHHSETSSHIAKCDAKKLYEAGEGSGAAGGGIDESTILEIFSKRSIPQLRLAISSYKHIYGHSYNKALKRQKNSGEFEDCLRVVIKCMHEPAKYYSKMLHTSLKTAAAVAMNKRELSRLMIGAAEAGMGEVKERFEKRYKKKLEDSLCDNVVAGDYRDFLMVLTDASNCIA